MLTRLKLRLAGNEKQLTIAFAVLGVVLLAGAAYVYAAPLLTAPAQQPEQPEQPEQPAEPRTETEVVPNRVFSINASIIDSAVVQEDSERYEDGRVLRRYPAYFKQYTPDLTLNITTRSTPNVTVDIRKELISQREVTRDDELVYVDNRTLTNRSHFAVTDGRTVWERTFNVEDEIEDPRARVDEDFSADEVSFDRRFILNIYYETEPINGTRYSGSLQIPETPGGDSFEINTADEVYWVSGKQSVNETVWNNGTRTVTLPPPDDPEPVETEPDRPEPDLQLVGILTMLGLAAFAIGAVIATKVPDIDEAELRAEAEHEEYSEWISEGELVLDATNEYVYVSSIEDLVNVAIDTDKRVIHDSDLSVYTVTDGEVIYYYTAEPSDLERWANI
ncbi:MAG: hypothetical protein A07HN63_00409 [uncultured archaeon A07HN63]|nr:MAG: hypothetical protein A07HN63_00409 [uncultured archaeon A07HN63]